MCFSLIQNNLRQAVSDTDTATLHHPTAGQRLLPTTSTFLDLGPKWTTVVKQYHHHNCNTYTNFNNRTFIWFHSWDARCEKDNGGEYVLPSGSTEYAGFNGSSIICIICQWGSVDDDQISGALYTCANLWNKSNMSVTKKKLQTRIE